MDTGREQMALAKALAALRNAQRRIQKLERAGQEPIAVVGMGCRFPGGVNSPERYWQLLSEARQAVSEIPEDRWRVDDYFDPSPGTPGKMYVRHGGFIEDPLGFDAELFGISPREAADLDPQQRVLLEVSWRALEDAGVPVRSLEGSRTGVFVGIGSDDFAQTAFWERADAIDTYSGTGTAACFAAGRLSYVLGLQGPSLAVQTACSSALVATHVGVQALRNRECDLVLAGGVHLMLRPETTVYLCRVRALAADGRCKVFQAGADGYVRGEGCGIFVLKRLSDALADSDRIVAVIRGSAVNHDGPASGLTVPNGLAQEAVLRAALQNAGVSADQVGYVEAHGTGTALGDPIEMEALHKVIASQRVRDRPLVVGSVKSNIGHLEPAAGAASLMKTILMLQHGEIPAQPNLGELNPRIADLGVNVDVPRVHSAWPDEGTRIAGVSSFGLSGTNAHVVVEQAPGEERTKRTAAIPFGLLTVSARTPASLDTLVGQTETRFEEATTPRDVSDLCFTSNVGRSHMKERAARVVSLSDGQDTVLSPFVGGWHRGKCDSNAAPRAGLIFVDQAVAYSGEGRELFEQSQVVRDAVGRCEAAIRKQLGCAFDVFLAQDPQQTKSLLYRHLRYLAFQCAVAELWRSLGVQVTVLCGVGAGEIAAACVAGALTVEDAVTLSAARVDALLAFSPEGSGTRLPARGNSAFAKAIEGIQPRRGETQLISGASGDVVAGEALDVSYWCSQLRAPASGSDFVAKVHDGCDVVLEVAAFGPTVAQTCLIQKPWLSTLERGKSEWLQVFDDVAKLYTLGLEPRFEYLVEKSARRTTLPGYPFQRASAVSRHSAAGVNAVPPALGGGPAVSPIAERRQVSRADVRGLEGVVWDQVCRVMGLVDPAAIPFNKGFFELGMDSMMAVELREGLERELGVSLDATVAFDHPSVEQLASHLSGSLAPATDEQDVAADAAEPVAIIGMSCRLPIGNSPDEVWRNLLAGKDGIRTMPGDRWRLEDFLGVDGEGAGKLYVSEGGFVDNVKRFDAGLFGISPREAVSIDPQQRLLLELTWEALERAGIAPSSIAGTRTGVFLGTNTADYMHEFLAERGALAVDAHFATGNTGSVAAGRISYTFGTTGPSLAIDTACSSSLVAMHLAVQSLRRGECDMALVAGVNLMLSPMPWIAMCRLGALAADGRSKPFSDEANGYGRGEGGAVLVLRRLSDARIHGNTIHAEIHGSAVNQDGASGGLTVPSRRAQTQVIRAALRDAHLSGAEVGYIETHGTGTVLGDPIEVQAIADALAPEHGSNGTEGRRVQLGSIKANIGHLEAASGIAGVIKAALSLKHQCIPPQIHVSRLNTRIDWSNLPLAVPTERTMWPSSYHPRTAGVSAFGFSGTNAHVVLREPSQAVDSDERLLDGAWPLVISARTAGACSRLAHGVAERLLTCRTVRELADVCFTACSGRSHLPHRIAVCVASAQQAATELRAQADSVRSQATFSSASRAVAFVLHGQPSADSEVVYQLRLEQPGFRKWYDHCLTLLNDLNPDEGRRSGGAKQTSSQSVLRFAFEYALCQMWQDWGVIPSFVVGWGVGEYVAACVAGALKVIDGLRLAHEFERVNSLGAATGSETFQFANAFEYGKAEISWVSSATGQPWDGQTLPASYWQTQLGNLDQGDTNGALTTVLDTGVRALLSIGLESPLERAASQCDEKGAVWISGLQRNWPIRTQLVERLCALYRAQVVIDWVAVFGQAPYRVVDLPTYPFEGQDFWFEPPARETPRAEQPVMQRLPLQASLLGRRLDTGASTFEGRWTSELEACASVHGIDVLRPGALLGALEEVGKTCVAGTTSEWRFREFEWEPGMVSIGESGRLGQLTIVPESSQGCHSFVVSTRQEGMGSAAWQPVLRGRLSAADSSEKPPAVDLARVRQRCGRSIAWTDVDGWLAELGFRSGIGQSCLRRIWLGKDVAVAQLASGPSLVASPRAALVEAAFQLAMAVGAEAGCLIEPRRCKELTWHGNPGDAVWLFAQTHERTAAGICLTLMVLDVSGGVLARFAETRWTWERGLAAPASSSVMDTSLCYDVDWVVVSEGQSQATVRQWIVVSDRSELALAVVHRLRQLCSEVTHVCVSESGAPPLESEGPTIACEADGLHTALERLLAGGHGPVTVLVLSASDATTEPNLQYESGLNLSIGLSCTFAVAVIGSRERSLWFVTRGACAVEPNDVVNPSQAALWGWGKGVSQEYPESWGGLLDLEWSSSPGNMQGDADSIVRAIVSTDAEDLLAIRREKLYGARVRHRTVEGVAIERLTVPRSAASYLVTGGLSKTGLQSALWLARNGAGAIILLDEEQPELVEEESEEGRGDRMATRPSLLRALYDTCERPHVLVGAEPASALALVATLADQGFPLAGVIHAAGTNFDRIRAPIHQLSHERVDSVLASKLTALPLIERLTDEHRLDFVWLFSSVSSVWGASSLAHYGAANSVLDATAARLAIQGKPVVSVNWGPWGGMGASVKEFERVGLPPIAPARALDTLSRVSAHTVGQVCIADLDWKRFKPIFESKRRSALLSEFSTSETSWPQAPSLNLELLRADPAEGRNALTEAVRQCVANVLGIASASDLNPREGFFDMGMDSILAVELTGTLSALLGRPLPATLSFDYPSLVDLVDYLWLQLSGNLIESGPRNSGTIRSHVPVEPQVMAQDGLSSLSEEQLAVLLAELVEG